MKQEVKKLLILNLPYLLFVYLFDKIGAAIRLTPGADASEKLLQLGTGFAAAFSSIAPSLHPADLLIGIAGAVIIRLAVYMKSKNAKKYRKGMEYGSARWGGAEDIKPYIDPVFENNVLLTQTERLMMSSRPKQPKYNPHELASYLTALLQSYTPQSAQAELNRVFDKQYTLTLTEEIEVRYRTETRTDTWTDEDGNSHSDTYTVEVPYNYYILNLQQQEHLYGVVQRQRKRHTEGIPRYELPAAAPPRPVKGRNGRSRTGTENSADHRAAAGAAPGYPYCADERKTRREIERDYRPSGTGNNGTL